MLQEIHPDLIERVTIQGLSYEQIIEACRYKDSKIFPLCNKKSFWTEKLEYDMAKEKLDVNEMLIDSSSKRRIRYVLMLVSKDGTFHADPTYKKGASITIASGKGYADVVEILLSHIVYGLDIKITEDEMLLYKNSIENALIGGHADVLKVLLKYLPNDYLFNQRKRDEALLDASSMGQTELVKFLIGEGGAFPGYQDSHAIIYAASAGHAKIL